MTKINLLIPYLSKTTIFKDNMSDKPTLKAVAIKATKSMESNMESVDSITKMAECIKASGLMATFKVTVNCFTNPSV